MQLFGRALALAVFAMVPSIADVDLEEVGLCTRANILSFQIIEDRGMASMSYLTEACLGAEFEYILGSWIVCIGIMCAGPVWQQIAVPWHCYFTR